MTSLWQSPAIVVAFIAWLAAPSGSLGEAALRETIRRMLTGPSAATLTNVGQPREMPIDASADTRAVAPRPGAAAADAAPVARNDEKAWRDRMRSARDALERDEVLAGAMQSRINGLQTDIVNRDDPGQQGQLRQQLARTLAELDRLKKLVETDRQAIADIQNEARKQGVPPGWIR